MESCDIARKYISICSNEETGYPSNICAAPKRHEGTICREELRSLKKCLFGDDESAYPLINKDNSRIPIISAIYNIISDIVMMSPACAAEAKPFLCLHLFGLCDATEGVSYQPSACYCRNLRDNVCADEWKKLKKMFPIILPDCDTEFLEEDVPCSSNYESDSTEDGMSSSLKFNV